MSLRFNSLQVDCTGNEARHIAYNYWFSKDGAAEEVANRSIRTRPHFLQIELCPEKHLSKVELCAEKRLSKIKSITNENCQRANPSHEPHPA